VITVFEHLHSQGKAEEVGGLAYLNSLAQYVPSAGNIRRYAEIVRERSILRKLVSASDEIATNAFNPRGDLSPPSWTSRAEDLQHRRAGPA
jgi:replicative DNA helicase